MKADIEKPEWVPRVLKLTFESEEEALAFKKLFDVLEPNNIHDPKDLECPLLGTLRKVHTESLAGIRKLLR